MSRKHVSTDLIPQAYINITLFSGNKAIIASSTGSWSQTRKVTLTARTESRIRPTKKPMRFPLQKVASRIISIVEKKPRITFKTDGQQKI